MLGSSMFRRQNLLKALSAAIVFSAGYSIMHYEEGLGWDLSSLLAIFAPACLELGVVFVISKFFFMAEDAELLVEKLEDQLAEARRSPGVGLAMSYFFNFLLPTCANLKDGVLDTSISVNNKPTNLSAGRHFFVFVPRSLEGVDIKQKLQMMQKNEGVAQGCIVFFLFFFRLVALIDLFCRKACRSQCNSSSHVCLSLGARRQRRNVWICV